VNDDIYQGFAERYDLFFDTFGEHPGATLEFFHNLFRDNGVHSVLDCACGTGHDLVMFQRLGFRVFGSDISDAMLAKAERNLAGLTHAIPLKRADYRELDKSYHSVFDAVVCLSSGILEMPNEAEAGKAFASMRNILADNGILVLSQGTTDKQWTEKPRFVLAVNKQGFSRVFVIDYVDRGARYNVLDIFHGDEGWDLKVWTGHYRNMLLRDDHERLLVQAGFHGITFYGSYAGDPYDRTSSDRLITVAHK
jgi:glycine/sarcosine N-methyltransferase